VCCALFKNLILKTVITLVASQVTGAPVHMDGFALGVFNPSVRISGFTMYNPSGFPKGILVSCPKINVAYDLPSLLKGKLHLTVVEFELKEMGLVKNKNGEFNVDSLKVSRQAKSSPSSKPSGMLPLQIDSFTLEIGKVVSKDYSSGAEPAVKVYEVNIHKSYKNITSAQQLVLLILAEPAKAAGIKGAQIYGAAMIAGVAVLPVAVAATFVGKDSVQDNFDTGFERLYEISLDTLKKMGKITKADAAAGVIGADIQGATVTLKLRKKTDAKTEITISARKYLLPKPDIAGGVLYQISEKMK